MGPKTAAIFATQDTAIPFPEHFHLFSFFSTIYLLLYISCIWQHFSGVYITFLLLHTFKEKKQKPSRTETHFSQCHLACIFCRHLVLSRCTALCFLLTLIFSVLFLFCQFSFFLSYFLLPPPHFIPLNTVFSILATMEINK